MSSTTAAGALPLESGSASDASASSMAALQHEAEHHTATVTTEVLAQEVQHHLPKKAAKAEKKQEERPEWQNELQEEPEIVELPFEIEVTDASSLSAEVDRLLPLLANVNESPWTSRVSSLKRIGALQREAAATQLDNFATEMWRLRTGIVEQLTDRRSLVVKQACDTIQALSTHFKAAFSDASSSSKSSEVVAQAQTIWIDLTAFFIDFLLPIIPITVQVMQSSACLCLNLILKNIAPLYREGNHDYPLLNHLFSTGITHKHGIVRDHCFRGISNSIIRLDARYVAYETALDAEENSKLQAAADAAATAANKPDDESTSITPAASSIATSSSPLFSKLESLIASGIHDSFDKTRAAARLCLIQFQTIAPLRADRIVRGMTAAQQKIYTQQKTEYTINKALAATKATSSSSSSSSSSALSNQSDDELELEMNPPPKQPAGKKKSTKKSAPAAASGVKSTIAAQKKAAFKGGKKADEEVIVVESKPAPVAAAAPKLSPAAQAEKKKEDDAAAVLAAAAASKAADGDDDEADEESTPVDSGVKAIKLKDEEEVDDEDEESTPASTAVAATSQYTRNLTLLSKLLDLETPMLTDRMIDFLLHEGVIDVFMSFIARVQQSEVDVEELHKVQQFTDLGAQYHNVFGDDTDVDETDAPKAEFTDLPLVHRSRPGGEDAAEQTAVRRSYHVMMLLCGQRQAQSLMAVLRTRIPAIVMKLMCVFHPKSKGNFFHACTVLQKLSSLFPATVLATLCSNNGRVLLSLMFDHLHEPPVIPLVLSFVQCSIESKVMSTLPSDLVQRLHLMDILHTKVVPRIIDCPTTSRIVSQASMDFLLQYIERVLSLANEKHSTSMSRFFADITQPGKAIELLTSALVNPQGRPAWQLSNIGILLHTLLTASSDESIIVANTDANAQALAQMTGNAAALQREVINSMFHLKVGIQQTMGRQLEGLCNLMTQGEDDASAAAAAAAAASTTVAATPASLLPPPSVQFSSYSVAVSFTSKRLQVLKIIIKLVQNDIDVVINEVDQVRARKMRQPNLIPVATPVELISTPRLFASIPHATWLTLIEWFFTRTHNNFFLGAFKTLFLSILQFAVTSWREKDGAMKAEATAAGTAPPSGVVHTCATDETFKFLFGEAKLINRMVAFYMVPNPVASCTRSYILTLGNHLRLSSDLLAHSSYLWHYLQSSQQWHTFLPVLTSESLKQAHHLHVRPFEEEKPEETLTALEKALGMLNSGGEGGPPANPNAFVIPPGFGEGVELGSVFAWHLGFQDRCAPVDKKKRKKKKKSAAKKAKKDAKKAAKEHDAEGSDDEDESDAGTESDSSASSSASSSPVKKPNLQLSTPSSDAADTEPASALSSSTPDPMQSPSPPISPLLFSPKAAGAASEASQ